MTGPDWWNNPGKPEPTSTPRQISDKELTTLVLGTFAGLVQLPQFPVMLHEDRFPEVNRDEGYFVFQTGSGLKIKVSVELLDEE